VKSTLVDIYFNAGTANLKTAIGSYKQVGATGLLQTVNNGDISNSSEKRKQLRVDLLEGTVKKESEAIKDK
jgi:GH24 family phage-related lysozyme (muramidase)